MKTVIIGTDFVYDSTGNIKPVEINTNVGLSVNKIENEDSEIFDSSDLISFINTNQFSRITYIGSNYRIKTFLQSVCNGLTIPFYEMMVSNESITVPFVEDSDDHLIIRTAYDTTAVLDEEYCKDKVNFLNLIKDTEFGSEFAYMNEDGIVVNNITQIKDNGNHPNFILKAKHPNYDKKVYPKLFKVTTQEELNVVLQNVNQNYFLMEFHINESKFYQNSVTKIRKLSLLYPPTLQSIHIGAYTDLTLESVSETISYDSETFELESDSRYMYITKDIGQIDLPKLLDDDFVVLADGSLKSGFDLQIGDVVKTINIPNISGIEIDADETESYNINYDTFINGVTYNTNTVTNKRRIDAFVRMCLIEFTDGSDWSDTINSRYLVLNEGIVKFKRLDNLVQGDVVLLVNTSDTNTVVIEQKEVVNTTPIAEKFSGWIMTVERTHLFLTKTGGSIEGSPSFAAIEHNSCNVECGKGQCCPTPWQMVSCVS
jgi:hypothetical protein